MRILFLFTLAVLISLNGVGDENKNDGNPIAKESDDSTFFKIVYYAGKAGLATTEFVVGGSILSANDVIEQKFDLLEKAAHKLNRFRATPSIEELSKTITNLETSLYEIKDNPLAKTEAHALKERIYSLKAKIRAGKGFRYNHITDPVVRDHYKKITVLGDDYALKANSLKTAEEDFRKVAREVEEGLTSEGTKLPRIRFIRLVRQGTGWLIVFDGVRRVVDLWSVDMSPKSATEVHVASPANSAVHSSGQKNGEP